MKKFAGLLTAAVLTALTLTGCAGSEAAGSADATAEHPLVLNLAQSPCRSLPTMWRKRAADVSG